MKWQQVTEHWNAFVPSILTRWPELDSDTVDAIEGDRTALLKEIVHTYQVPAREAEDELATWMEGATPADVIMDPEMDNERITAVADNIPEGEDAYDDDRRFGDDGYEANPIGRTDA